MVPAGMTSHQRRHRSCTPRRDHKAVVTAAIVLWAVCALVCSEDSVEAGNEVHVVEDVDAWDTSKTLVVNEVSGIHPTLPACCHPSAQLAFTPTSCVAHASLFAIVLVTSIIIAPL